MNCSEQSLVHRGQWIAAVYEALRNVGMMFLPGMNLMAFTCFRAVSMRTFYLFIYSQDYMFFVGARKNSGNDFTHNTLCLDFVIRFYCLVS